MSLVRRAVHAAAFGFGVVQTALCFSFTVPIFSKRQFLDRLPNWPRSFQE
jgi:peptidoglycan biosynthesis protein MviN/MurJ (putative lipid II flippase)